MKPKNKFQREIVSLSKRMNPITEKQKQYAYRHCFEPFAKRTSKGFYTCSDCANTWNDNLSYVPNHVTCPHCGRKLKVCTDRKKKYSNKVYFTIITAKNGYQVFRHFVVSVNISVGTPAQYSICEVVQRWLSSKGVTYTIALSRCMYNSCYIDKWSFSSKLELKSCSDNFVYDIDAKFVYPKMKFIDIIKRNGFNGETYDMTYYTIFKAILSDNKMETLFKCGQISLFKYFVNRGCISDDIWKAIKICIRHKYDFSDINLWVDYIKLLLYFGKDISNPHYVCPANLRKEHDRFCRKKHDEFVRLKLIEKQRKACHEEKRYQEAKSKFFGLVFIEGDIQIRVLESVQEFSEEGKFMHHCVFSNEYFKNVNSLIFSAMVHGVKTETIEVSLDTMQVVQCRGKFNMDSEYHDEILRVMRKNIPLIAKRMCG